MTTPEPQASEPPTPAPGTHNARIGWYLFAIYLFVYAVFVILNAFQPTTMETNLLGVNLAICFGMGLIVFAFILAIVYSFLCKDHK